MTAMTSVARIGLLVMACVVACIKPAAVECDFGTCPAGTLCDELHGRCVIQAQLTDCIGQALDAACTVDGREGVCVDEVCLEKGCGDTRVNGAERCDGTTFVTTASGEQAAGCKDLGYYADGPIVCRSDCTIDETACEALGFCGDGLQQPAANELCDYRAPDSSRTCDELGWYRGGDAPCTTLCSYDISGCSGRCGDGTVDAPDELCEPTHGIPSPLSCLTYGFDSGVLACSSACAADLAVCKHHGLWSVGAYSFVPADIWQASALEAFVVGRVVGVGGLLLRWNGSDLTPVKPASGDNLFAVSGSSATDVIAVGDNGRIARYDGSALVAMTSPTTSHLRGVHVRAANEAYAIGYSGTVLAYAGTAWTRDTTFPSTATVEQVFATSSTDLWVSTSESTSEYRLYHRSGTTWSLAQTFDSSIVSIWGTSATNLYVVTRNPTHAIWHFNGTWNNEPVTGLDGFPLNLRDLSGTAADNVVAVGDGGTFAHFDGERWTVLRADTSSTLMAVDARALTSAVTLTFEGQVLRWEGAGWTRSDAQTRARGMWGTSLSALFAATDAAVRSYDPTYPPTGSTHWKIVGTTVGMVDVWGTSASDVWAVGGSSKVYHYTSGGTTSTDLSTLVSGISVSDITGVAGTRFVIGYAFSGNDAVVFSDTGTGFSVMHTIDNAQPISIWAHATDRVWVATTMSIYHYNGSSWTLVHTDPSTMFNDLWGTAANDVWAVGTGGTVMHFDGASWTKSPVQTTRTLSRIHGTSASDIFIGGDETLLHFDGTGWSPIRLPLTGVNALWASEHDIGVWSQSEMRFLHRACLTCL
jgi:hypothetical protein